MPDNYNLKEERLLLAYSVGEVSPLTAGAEAELAWKYDKMGQTARSQ